MRGEGGMPLLAHDDSCHGVELEEDEEVDDKVVEEEEPGEIRGVGSGDDEGPDGDAEEAEGKAEEEGSLEDAVDIHAITDAVWLVDQLIWVLGHLEFEDPDELSPHEHVED